MKNRETKYGTTDIRVKIDRQFWNERFKSYAKAVTAALDGYKHELKQASFRIELMEKDELVNYLLGNERCKDYWVAEAIRIWCDMKKGEDRFRIQNLINFLRG